VGRSVLAPLTRAGALISAIMVAVASGPLAANEHRSREVTREFQREHPCPATGRANGACPGYRKDHIEPLACGGPDAVWNLQWQTIRAMADDTRCQGQGQMEAQGLRPQGVRAPPRPARPYRPAAQALAFLP
jgi:hypothetical protein